jgi:hypothetical protein
MKRLAIIGLAAFMLVAGAAQAPSAERAVFTELFGATW